MKVYESFKDELKEFKKEYKLDYLKTAKDLEHIFGKPGVLRVLIILSLSDRPMRQKEIQLLTKLNSTIQNRALTFMVKEKLATKKKILVEEPRKEKVIHYNLTPKGEDLSFLIESISHLHKKYSKKK